MKVKSLSRVRLLATPGIIAYQAPPSMRFSRQKYWSGWPLPSMNRLGVLYISASLTFALHHMTSFWQWIVSRCEASITRSFNCASVVWLGLFSFCACTTKVTALLRKKGADLNPIHSLKQSHFDWPANLSGKKKKKKKEYIFSCFKPLRFGAYCFVTSLSRDLRDTRRNEETEAQRKKKAFLKII